MSDTLRKRLLERCGLAKPEFASPPMRVSSLPQVQAQAAYAWAEGWWQGIAVGFILGACVAVIVFKH